VAVARLQDAYKLTQLLQGNSPGWRGGQPGLFEPGGNLPGQTFAGASLKRWLYPVVPLAFPRLFEAESDQRSQPM